MPETSPLQHITAKLRGINRLFLVAVAIPTLASSIYYGCIASDVYTSESRFVVRSPQRQSSTTSLSSLLQGNGFGRSQDDAYVVHDYIQSRDALEQLEKQLNIKAAYSSPQVDPFSRFGLLGQSNLEELFLYYKKHIQVDHDGVSSITTLKVQAYTSKDAYKINEKLLELSEQLVNRLNERGRNDMIRFAEDEVARAEQRAKAAALALSSFRKQKAVFDPERQSSLQLQQVSKLQDELIASKMQLVQIRSATPNNPQISVLEKRIATLQADIESETAKVVGEGASLSTKASEYERLALEREFADKMLATALASYEQARNDVLRKQLYLERIVQPSTPDQATEPKRLHGILATLAIGMILWGVLSLLIAAIREHRD